jgi:hypothetical protein
MPREIDHKIWQCLLHTFERQPRNNKVKEEAVSQEGIDDYQFKSCILCQNAGSWVTGRKI